MTDYRVKNFNCKNGGMLQKKIEEWIESRKHITIKHMNIWNNQDYHYCTIVYTETTYTL